MSDSSLPTGEEFSDWQRRAGFERLSPEEASRLLSIDWRRINTDSSDPMIAWLGHASFLLVWKGTRILIDPVFSRLVGIIPRRCPVPYQWRGLNPDHILLSHAHMDHMDLPAIGGYPDAKIHVPKGSMRFLRNADHDRSHEVSVNQTISLGRIQVTAIPAKHGGWRYPWQRGCEAHGYIFSDGLQSVLYAGDTAYGNHFSRIAEKFKIDLAILPIGAYSPQWFLKSRHMNPSEAVKAAGDLRARQVIPCHFGSFRLSLEPLYEPLPWFARVAAQANLDWFLPVGIV